MLVFDHMTTQTVWKLKYLKNICTLAIKTLTIRYLGGTNEWHASKTSTSNQRDNNLIYDKCMTSIQSTITTIQVQQDVKTSSYGR